MGTRRLLLAGALILLSGCTQPQRRPGIEARAQWERLCSRLRTEPTRERGAGPQATPTAGEQNALLAAARAAGASVVRLETVVPLASVSEPSGRSPRVASRPSGGTGVVVAPGGTILTNAHVVRDATQVTVCCADGRRYPVSRVAVHPHLDLAVLRIERDDLRPVPPAEHPPAAGSAVVALGGTSSLVSAVRTGVVTDSELSLQNALDPTRRYDYGRLIASTTRLEPGFSGGPLLDAQGALVGLNVAAAGASETGSSRGYAIPFDARTRAAITELQTQLGAATRTR
jgi:S1-C subfamily serine protease